MKHPNFIRILFSTALLAACAHPGNLMAQVSIRDRIEIMDRDIFNYPASSPELPVKTKKNKTNRIVYSDRNGNQSYEDPYFQRKRSSYDIGTPYYIVGEKNGNYKVVQAEPDITGKPKSFFGFLFNGKRHFKEPGKVKYAGWIPSDNMLMYDHACLNPRNNQPIRYRIGINSIDRLFDIHQFFSGDTLKVYGDPFLKTQTADGVTTGEVVYLYKVDKTGKSALISNAPALSDTTKRFWAGCLLTFLRRSARMKYMQCNTHSTVIPCHVRSNWCIPIPLPCTMRISKDSYCSIWTEIRNILRRTTVSA